MVTQSQQGTFVLCDVTSVWGREGSLSKREELIEFSDGKVSGVFPSQGKPTGVFSTGQPESIARVMMKVHSFDHRNLLLEEVLWYAWTIARYRVSNGLFKRIWWHKSRTAHRMM